MHRKDFRSGSKTVQAHNVPKPMNYHKNRTSAIKGQKKQCNIGLPRCELHIL